ncbi:hypothetical protein MASR1M68_11060 [Elusimicrobiota bacterium]
MNNSIKTKILGFTKEYILNLSNEQFAGLILEMLRGNDTNFYKKDFISIENLFEDYGINKKFNINYFHGGVEEHRGTPKEIEKMYNDSFDFLMKHKFIQNALGQDPSARWIVLTEDGKNIKINEDFTLLIERTEKDLVSIYKESVFLIEIHKQKDKYPGTCFLYNKQLGIFITAKHVIEHAEKFIIYLTEDKSIIIPSDCFNITLLEKIDVAVLRVKEDKKECIKHLQDFKSFSDLANNFKQGEDVVFFGYPHIAWLKDINLLTQKGSIASNPLLTYHGENLYCIVPTLTPGYSGGPIINLKGELVGLVSINYYSPETSDIIESNKNEFTLFVPMLDFKNSL